MDFKLAVPEFSGNLDFRRLRSYLVRLNEELRYVLSNIDSENFTAETAETLGASKSVKKEVSTLKESIVNTATFIRSVEEKLTATLKNEYVAVSDVGTYTENAIASYEVDGKGLDQYFSVVSSVDEEVSKLCGYIKTGVLDDGTVGLEIANFGTDGDAPFKVRLSDNKLSFFAGGVEVAYMSDSTLYITKAHIKGALVLGKYHVDVTDGVAFMWIEG